MRVPRSLEFRRTSGLVENNVHEPCIVTLPCRLADIACRLFDNSAIKSQGGITGADRSFCCVRDSRGTLKIT